MPKHEYDAAIVGAGPAGLFTAYEYTKQAGESSVAVFDKGGDLQHRICPFETLNGCACRNCGVNEGLMGAGLFSDGKLHFHEEIIALAQAGIISSEETTELLQYAEGLFEEWGLDSQVFPVSNESAVELSEAVRKLGLGGDFELLVKKRTRHVGSDRLPALVGRMVTQICSQGDVDINLRSKLVDYDNKDGVSVLTIQKGGEVGGDIRKIMAEKAFIALGRRGSWQVQDMIDKFSIPHSYRPVQIGGRVEVPSEVLKNITDINYNPCFRQEENGASTFTFCANPQGFLTIESLVPNVAGVNGESKADIKSSFTNFAVLTEVPVPPGEHPNNVLRELLQDRFSNKVPLVQTTADFVEKTVKDERRPRKSTVNTLEYANIAQTLPSSVAREIGSFLLRLNEVCPGVVSNDALFIAPEAKIRGMQIAPENKYLETNVPGLHLIGDASGLSTNIVAAAINGILAARGGSRK